MKHILLYRRFLTQDSFEGYIFFFRVRSSSLEKDTKVLKGRENFEAENV